MDKTTSILIQLSPDQLKAIVEDAIRQVMVPRNTSTYLNLKEILDRVGISRTVFYSNASNYRYDLIDFGLHQRQGVKSEWRMREANFEMYMKYKEGALSREEALEQIKKF